MSDSTLPNFDALWNYSQPAETENAFRQVRNDVVDSAPETYLLELDTQIARTLGLQRKFDEAHSLLDAVEARAAEVGGRPNIRYLLERGRALNSSGHKDKAHPLFVQAWEIGREIGEDGLAVDAAHMVAIVETPEAALQWNLTALELATTSEMPAARKWRKSLHNNLGWTFYDLKQFDIALYHFKKCQELALENNDVEFERIARWCIAKVLRVQGNLDEALSMQFGQLAELEKVGRTSGFVFEELAECLYALGRADQAAPYFHKAYEELSKDPWISEGEPDRISRLKDLSV